MRDLANVSTLNSFLFHSLYQRTFLYRDLKLRGAIVQAGQLIIMPEEQVYSQVQGVWNLSSDQGNLGSFVVTNIRLVWFADANETFNLSLPYLQIEAVSPVLSTLPSDIFHIGTLPAAHTRVQVWPGSCHPDG